MNGSVKSHHHHEDHRYAEDTHERYRQRPKDPETVANGNIRKPPTTSSKLCHQETVSSHIQTQRTSSSEIQQQETSSGIQNQQRGYYSIQCRRSISSKIQDQGTTVSSKRHNDQTRKTSSAKHLTLNAEDVNFVFFEPFIHTGYRQEGQPWRYYLTSALWLHNESLNVWTHALGCCLIVARTLLLLQDIGGWQDPRSTAVVGFSLGCFLTNLLSTAAHLLHSKSPRHHYILYLMDYAGITLYIAGNALGSMYLCSHPRTYSQMESFFLPSVVVLSWLSFLVCVQARLYYKGHFQIRRKLIMIAVFLALSVFMGWPMAGRYLDCLNDPGCSLTSLNHITIVFVTYVVDAVFYSAHAPERWWPGKFDIWGHGHQWFHVGVMITQQLQLHALHVDLVERNRAGHADLHPISMLMAYVTLALAQALTLRYLSSAINSKVADDNLHLHEKDHSD